MNLQHSPEPATTLYQERARELLEAAFASSLGLPPASLRDEKAATILANALTGFNRAFDSDIEGLVSSKLQRQSGHLEILELAAGSSLPSHSVHYGAPWLSRKLAWQFGERVQSTVSDIDPSIRLFVVRGGSLSESVLVNQRGEVHATEPPEQSLRLAATLWADECKTRQCAPDTLPENVRKHLRDRGPAAKDTQVWAAPMLCQSIESVFGIRRAMVGVDLLKLDDHFPACCFDVVFARHLVQRLCTAALSDIAAQTARVLKPDGLGLIAFDRADSAPQALWTIYPDGGYRLCDYRGDLSSLNAPLTEG